MVIKRKNREFECHKLNKAIHHPNEDLEWRKETNNEDKCFLNNRLGLRGIALTRDLGCANLDDDGLIHIPDVDEIEFELFPGAEPIVILGCDGILEDIEKEIEDGIKTQQEIKNIISDQEEVILKVVKENWGKSSQEIAYAIGERAVKANSADNISVIVFKPRDKCVCAKIFDGHNGKEVAEFLPSKFNEVMQAEINKMNNFKEINLEIKGLLKLLANLENISDKEAIATMQKKLNENNAEQIFADIKKIAETKKKCFGKDD